MSRLTRRRFVQLAAGLGATAAGRFHADFVIAGTKSSPRVLGANNRIRVAVAGLNQRGAEHIREYANMKGVEIAYLVDPDSSLFASRIKSVEQLTDKRPKCVQDLRKALEDKTLDAVSIASPNHWHTLLTVWGCQAGKHVYVEKPCSHTIFEGRKCIEAAERYGVVVQHGTQQRSDSHRASEIAALQAGKWGKLLVSKAYVCKPRPSIGFKPDEAAPATLNFDHWTGPAKLRPFNRNLVHYNWHWFWDFGNGEIGNQGVHQTDVAHWSLGPTATLPTRVWSLGGRLGYKDQGQTPNMQLAVYEFGEISVVIEVRGLVERGKKAESEVDFPSKVFNEFYTSEGMVRNGKFFRKQGSKEHQVTVEPVHVTPGGAFGSFIACVRNHAPGAVNAPIRDGHYAAALCHLANISYCLGKEVSFNQEPDGMSNRQIADSFEMIKGNLKGVGVNLDKATYRMGRTLNIDPKAERFIGDPEANKLLTREYRAGYEVPEKV
ncbi:MAG: Gfo/Idh/MocA family protein [Thermoguttaceae bacterium]